MARIYLETSFVSACVTNRSDVASVYRREVSKQWWQEQSAHHEVVVSEEVIRELSDPEFKCREAALVLITPISVLRVNDDVRGLAKLLVAEKVMPGPAAAGDALHVAFATVDRVDYLVSWNVRHLANINKIEHLQRICRRVGYFPPQIVTPEIIWE